MSRPPELQAFLDTAMPVMQARASDPRSPASLERIIEAMTVEAERGASPAELPVCDWLKTALDPDPETPDIAAVFAAFRKLAPHLRWRTRSGAPTASEGFAESHANAMLLGPGGIEDRHDLWLGVSLLAPGTRYPDHQHLPEETYLVLSPGEFRKEGGDWFRPGVGGSFFVPPNSVHAMRAEPDAPLFALWALRPERGEKSVPDA
ncbi:dimethylsulfonioproprionate lyase family protein [Paracoccus aminophilus]|uniref:Transcriptional regulator n=1 Tax=Paracoccus aminophilus JCM 7686 TaxID=1367847 RepID=S5XV71_PARAH|nr:dimethylsulfonioproprionate lyase family protein [Paracoccus aminophilus]AGT11419.1 transcriptional regulator [Paracoccus aminophilus JCM 7686]